MFRLLSARSAFFFSIFILSVIVLNIWGSLFSEKISQLPVSVTKEAIDHIVSEIAEEEITPQDTKILHVVRSGDTLFSILQQNQLSPTTIVQITQSLKKEKLTTTLNLGQEVKLQLAEDEDRNYKIAQKIDITGIKPYNISIALTEDGGYQAQKLTLTAKTVTKTISSEITTSLYVDALKAGADNNAVGNFIKIFSYIIDFQRDIKQGSKFSMYYEVEKDENGKIVKMGDIIYGSIEVNGKKKELYKFRNSKGEVMYIDQHGAPAKRGLLRTPINGARISSKFGMRKHPISGYNKMHTGIDFAAPRGTPIYAAADGVITFVKRSTTGYGRHIKIKHNGVYSTLYGHMDRFASGMKSGTKVRAGQIIGYVGATGAATGPHLHYEVHKNGKKIDPASSTYAIEHKLDANELARFKQEKSGIDQSLKVA